VNDAEAGIPSNRPSRARALSLALSVAVLAGCSSGHHEVTRVYQIADVKRAFARHGIALQVRLLGPRDSPLQAVLGPATNTEQIDVNVFRNTRQAKKFVGDTTHQKARFRFDVAGNTVFYKGNVEVVYDRGRGSGRLDDVDAALRDLP
jgi:hypothetical protein